MQNGLSKWWEATSLQNYLNTGLIPSGLCNFTMPSYESPDKRMLDEWALNSTEWSKNTLRILVKYAKSDREKL